MDWKMYTMLFNAITDALENLDDGDVGAARIRLMSAQRKTEEMYISNDPQKDSLTMRLNVTG